VLRFPKAPAGRGLPAVRRTDGLDVLAEHGTNDVLIISAGAMAAECLRAAQLLAAERIGVTVVDPRWVLPANPAIAELAAAYALVVTVEDNTLAGGVGAAVTRLFADRGVTTPVCALGLRPEFLEPGKRAALLAWAGLDGERLAQRVLQELENRFGPHPECPAPRRAREQVEAAL